MFGGDIEDMYRSLGTRASAARSRDDAPSDPFATILVCLLFLPAIVLAVPIGGLLWLLHSLYRVLTGKGGDE